MDITPDKKNLMGLVQGAREGLIVLPNFQRNFVWKREDVKDLLVSVLKKYFIGSFLLLRTDSDNLPFSPRAIVGARVPDDMVRPDWMILDGQQRLTSLEYVFSCPDIPLKGTKYPYRFFLDLKKVTKGDLDDAVFSRRSDKCKEYYAKSEQFRRQIIPFSEIIEWSRWKREYESNLLKNDQEHFVKTYHPDISPIWDRVVGGIHSFFVATIEIPKVSPDDDEKVGEVCAIFEKMNSTGVSLSVFDLLTARLYKSSINLHELWEESVEKHENLRKLSDKDPDPYAVYVLRALALMRGLEVKSKVLINLKPDGFAEDWRIASKYMEKALKRITSTSDDGFGVFDTKWFPYTTMTPVLAAMLRLLDSQGKKAEGLSSVKKWYWGSVFLERYAGATDTLAHQDFNDIRKLLEDSSFVPRVFDNIEREISKNPAYDLRTTSRRTATYKGIMNLVGIEGAKDFLTGDSIEFSKLDDHHIFPKKYLSRLKDPDSKKRKYKKDSVNTIINRTLIASSTNKKISRRAPSDYVVTVLPDDKRESILASHFIDGDCLNAMESNNYDTFLDIREKSLIEEIRKRIG